MSIIRFILGALLAFPCLGTVGNGTAWDVRTTGSDSNGGAFDSGVVSPGTDFSQQNSAQIAYTDIVVGGTTTQGTSALNPFDATLPGNIINIVSGSGCTVQRVEVLSVSGTTATFDKSLGTAASVCTGNLGGSMLNWYTIISTLALGTDNTIWLKSGTYSQTALHGIGSVNMTMSGYLATHGDLNASTPYSSNPLITTATNGVGLVQMCGNYYAIKSINFTNTAGSPSTGIDNTNGGCTGGYLWLSHVQMSGFTSSVLQTNAAGASTVTAEDCDFGAASTAGINNQTSGAPVFVYAVHSYFHTGSIGVLTQVVPIPLQLVLIGNTFSGGTTGVQTGYSYILAVGNNFYNASGNGATFVSSGAIVWMNNVVYGNGGFGISFGGTGRIIASNSNNFYGSNTSGARNGLAVGANDGTLTANPWVNSGSDNFALNATAGGGALLKQAAFPGVGPFGTGYLDVGPVQTSGGPGSGGATAASFAWLKR